jgi:cell division protein FtsX
MNKQDVIEIAKTLGEHASPQLRTYIYVEWFGWLTFFIIAITTLALIWKFRARINALLLDFPAAQIALAFGVFMLGVLAIAFVPYTLHVLTTPELEAIKSLFRK